MDLYVKKEGGRVKEISIIIHTYKGVTAAFNDEQAQRIERLYARA